MNIAGYDKIVVAYYQSNVQVVQQITIFTSTQKCSRMEKQIICPKNEGGVDWEI